LFQGQRGVDEKAVFHAKTMRQNRFEISEDEKKFMSFLEKPENR